MRAAIVHVNNPSDGKLVAVEDGHTDVIIVGAGTAGCVVAEHLSRFPAVRVTVVEAGPSGVTSPDLFSALATPGRLWPDVTATRTPGRAPRLYPRGRGVGGSGAVNGLVAIAPTPGDLRRWQSAGLDLTGAGKPPTTAIPTSQWGPADRMLAVAMRSLGYPALRYASAEMDGVGPVPLHLSADGLRASTDTTHLAIAAARDNVTIHTDATVDRLIIDATGTCRGVLLTNGTELLSARTIVCAGAIHSPALLLRSGLTRSGIGANLADHPAVGITLHLREPASPDTLATCAVGHVGSTQLLTLNRLGTTGELQKLGAILAGVLHSNGRGNVTIDEAGRPVVAFDLLSHPSDRKAIVRASRLLVSLATQPCVETETTDVSIDDHGTSVDTLLGASDDSILAWAEANLADYVHATGTCAYGLGDDPNAVVGPGGLVHGTPGLAVIDASVFPTPPSANPWHATVQLAEVLSAQLATTLR
jgi:choline dehydrogenase-like flavoprotein